MSIEFWISAACVWGVLSIVAACIFYSEDRKPSTDHKPINVKYYDDSADFVHYVERRFKGTSVQIGNVKVARNMVNMSTAECLRNEDDNIEWFVAAGRNIAIRNGTWEDYEIERLFKIFRATRARLYDERKERRIKNTGQIEQVAHYD